MADTSGSLFLTDVPQTSVCGDVESEKPKSCIHGLVAEGISAGIVEPEQFLYARLFEMGEVFGADAHSLG